MAPDRLAGRDVIVEFIGMGDVVRVCAVDTETGREAVIAGPASAARGDLERVALAKLAKLLTEEHDEPAAPSRRGRLA